MRLNPRQIAIALAVTGAAVTTTANAARDTIQIAGSSTVLPFASVVAEEFGNTFPQFKTPVVGSGGSSAGLNSSVKVLVTTQSTLQTLLVKLKALKSKLVTKLV